MQFSEHWLRTLVNPAIDSAELERLLTMAGLEVEEATPAAPAFTGVLVARILSAEQHPNADRLRVCRVDVGAAEPLQIVCGAPNAAAGLLVPCATVGAVLPGDFKIKPAKLRGVESAGMLCSARELGLSEAHEGLLSLPEDFKPGTSLRDALLLDDTLYTIKLTPNRPDCLSLLGIAREVSALTGAPLAEPKSETVAASHDATRAIDVEAKDACPRYCGRVIRGIDPSRKTPDWIVQRIERCGIRSISAVVDITNYVMLELGQPMHAFDTAILSGSLRVRWAKEGEALTLLNEQEVKLDAKTLVIADDEKTLAMAGIMGGDRSGISDETTDIFVESAFFSPAAIAGRAREYGLATDSSHRYERGVDYALPARAIERASELILAICGGNAGPVVEVLSEEHLPRRSPVVMRMARASQVIGIPLDAETVATVLSRLGGELTVTADEVRLLPPSWRFDLEIEQDLIEEIARIYGYEKIPEVMPVGKMAMLPQPESRRTPMALRAKMAGLDYQEVINYAFVEEAWERDFCANKDLIRIANPIASQLAVMRSSLLGGLVGNLITNQKRRASRVRLFEIGRCFKRDPAAKPVAGYDQTMKIAALAWGPSDPEQWGIATRKADFFDIKGDLERLVANPALEFVPLAHPALHPGRAAEVRIGGRAIGWIGELHPTWVHDYDLASAPVAFELELDAVMPRVLPTAVAPSKFPPMIRDLALIVEATRPVAELLDVLRSAPEPLMQSVEVFDVYQGRGVEPDRKSVAFRIRFQHTERTLEDREVDAAVEVLVGLARARLGAELRS
ncbi:phenylalanine--tRNA ligase subunit beta [Niveibacterium terrae]|uniref:phenylalanine--tRNA ligase subunit beta n=1 Tax=Niveibacterium terrae TaxID=3373598 RepID=UPI003A91960E